jgi:hypothetical protein
MQEQERHAGGEYEAKQKAGHVPPAFVRKARASVTGYVTVAAVVRLGSDPAVVIGPLA